MHQVLFLCTGNYYRSRFAEVLFNHLAAHARLPWTAASRGLRVRPESGNVGPLSLHAAAGLTARGIPLPGERMPLQVTTHDLTAADLIIALKQAEHLPLMQNLFPDFVSRARYWHVHDLDAALPPEALAELQTLVEALIAELSPSAR